MSMIPTASIKIGIVLDKNDHILIIKNLKLVNDFSSYNENEGDLYFNLDEQNN